MIRLHGNGWFAGTRRDNLEIAMATLLASAGFVSVSIEYRLSSEATFLAQIHDVKAAIRWLRASTATYGSTLITSAPRGRRLAMDWRRWRDSLAIDQSWRGIPVPPATPAAYRQSR